MGRREGGDNGLINIGEVLEAVRGQFCRPLDPCMTLRPLDGPWTLG